MSRVEVNFDTPIVDQVARAIATTVVIEIQIEVQADELDMVEFTL